MEGVERFNVEQKVETKDMSFLKNNMDRLLGENDHLSVYLFPFTDRCRINTWNRTGKRRSILGDLREFVRTRRRPGCGVDRQLTVLRCLLRTSPPRHGVERGLTYAGEHKPSAGRSTIYIRNWSSRCLSRYLRGLQALHRSLETCTLRLPYALFEYVYARTRPTLIGAGGSVALLG